MFLHELDISGLTIKIPRIAFSRMTILSLAMVCACARLIGAEQQSPGLQEPQGDKPHVMGVIRIPLTVVHFSVYDRDEKRVDGLDHDACQVFEDNVRQKTVIFSQEDEPATIGLLIDTSRSMADKMSATTEAFRQFIQVSNPADKFFAASFGDHVERITSAEELNTLLAKPPSQGRTAMLDALYLALVELQGTRNSRKALLIITDGGDNNGRYSRADLRKLVKEAGVPVYCLMVGEESNSATQEEPSDEPGFLAEICKQTSGRLMRAISLREMPGLAARIGIEFRKQYMLGYYPTDAVQSPNGPRWRKIEVKVQSKGVRGPLKIYAPSGYIYSVDGSIL